MDCVFCKIANGVFSSFKIFEDENVVAILDVAPTSIGHTLILPKNHYANILECDENTLNSINKAIKIVGNALLKTYADGINVLSNINESAGQTVMHAHVHLIPVNKDGKKANISFSEIKDVNLEQIKENIVNNMKKN